MKKRYNNIFLGYAIIFFLCGLFFLFLPNQIIFFINQMGSFQTFFTPLGPSPHYFWIVLTLSMMMMITYACYQLYKDLSQRAYLNILLLSKAVSSFTYLVLLFCDQRAFGYLIGFLVDGLIFLSLLFMEKKMKVE